MLEIVYRPLKALAPYAKNSRTHSAEQIANIVGSLKLFGWTNSLLIADGTIIAGHARLMAALRMAEEKIPIPRNEDPWQAPTVDLSHLDKHERAAYVIADNQLALAGSAWNDDLLAEELGWLNDEGFGLDIIGFDNDDLSRLLGGTAPGEGATDPDEIPETPLHPVTKPGDIWLLGKHRLMCGDSTDVHTVSAAMGEVSPSLMVTDPPYGVDYDPQDRANARYANGKPLSVGMKRALGKVQNDEPGIDWGPAIKLFPGDVAYLWHSAINPGPAQTMLSEAGFQIRMQIIWAKSKFVVSRGHYHMQHEPCYYAVRKGKTANWTGDRKQSTLWQIDKQPKNMSGHSTEKPIDCMLRPIENNSSPGQVVYDPFAGAATTLMACEVSARTCITIEILPAHVDTGIKRWQNYSLQQAVLESTGMTYDEMASERPFVS